MEQKKLMETGIPRTEKREPETFKVGRFACFSTSRLQIWDTPAKSSVISVCPVMLPVTWRPIAKSACLRHRRLPCQAYPRQ
jgi:hypothetical protein